MNIPRSKTVADAEGEPPVPVGVPPDEPSIWDRLSEEDRASIERGRAQSLAGLYATDEAVEAAFAAFGP